MSNIFKDVQMAKVGSNSFNMTHDVKTSLRLGELTPIGTAEVIPGDQWSLSNEMMLRLAPLVSPVMHIIDAHIHTFFVPYRILWSEWEDFITGESTALPPTFAATNGRCDPGSLGHYLGYRTNADSRWLSTFPFSAYLKIYDEYYRDQNLQTEKWYPLVAGNQGYTGSITEIANRPPYRAWEHDYFTSALPFAQKGDPVTLPLTNSSTVEVDFNTGTGIGIIESGSATGADGDLKQTPTTDGLGGKRGYLRDAAGVTAAYDPDGTLTVDVNDQAVSIATLRRAFKMQEFLEKDARGGTRYIENILSHFGVQGRDRRLQRPHYIGGMKANVQISEVLATAQSSDDVATAEQVVGQQSGHGISVGTGRSQKFTADEHGVIISILSIRPKTAYINGLHRMFTRNDRFDFAWPSFAHIGEQPVYTYELNANQLTAAGDTVFGYVPRYAEYKYQDSKVTGLMATDLEYWHLGRSITGAPVLNTSFIECSPRTNIFADTTGDHVIGHILNKWHVRRKLPVFGNPTI